MSKLNTQNNLTNPTNNSVMNNDRLLSVESNFDQVHQLEKDCFNEDIEEVKVFF